MADRDYFAVALRKARMAEAAQLEATMNIRDARALRLESLRDAVKLRLQGNEKAVGLFDLVVLPGAKPKLWVDLVSSVVMEPDPRSYQLMLDREATSEVIFQSTSEAEMVDYLTTYLAHRMVAHDKAAAGLPMVVSKAGSRYSLLDMIYVWATGCLFGVMTLLTIAMYLGKLRF